VREARPGHVRQPGVPPPGGPGATASRGIRPHPRALRVPPPGSAEAAALENPERIDGSALHKGKRFTGSTARRATALPEKGTAPVAKKFVRPPPTSPRAQRAGAAVGELFAVLTHGKNGMPSFRTTSLRGSGGSSPPMPKR
jgi:hypothetical protein